MISAGLAFWSVMTALSGTAKTFGALLTFRVGVGIGEASATPAALSMLSDYFAPKTRATVMAIYSSGIYIGGGIGGAIGGVVLDTWHRWFPDPTAAPLALRGWQMAFLLVGIPGVLLALWVKSLREPIRGMSEDLSVTPEPHPFRVVGRESMGVLPGLNFVNLVMNKASPEALPLTGRAVRHGRRCLGLTRGWRIPCNGSRWASASIARSRGLRIDYPLTGGVQRHIQKPHPSC